ncbi:MAG: phosphoribosylglycinamide formyltransferase [Gemmatimonadota bacterium]
MIRVAVLASGSGTTFQALLDHVQDHRPGWEVVTLVSDRPDAHALDRARAAGIDACVIPVTGRPDAEVAEETLAHLRVRGADVVALAGYLRLVPAALVEAFPDRMLNVHPALLPAFGGKGMYGDHVHRAVLAAGARLTGPTVHLVNAEYDRGRPLAQWPVPVLAGDEVASLRGRVQSAERALYPLVLDHVCHALSGGRPVTPLDWSGAWLAVAPTGVSDPSTLMRTSCT